MRIRFLIAEALLALALIGGAIGAGVAASFTNSQIRAQLAPQHIVFPADAAHGLPANLHAYAGQQVVNGDQAHAYAEDFIGLHLKESGKSQPYSYWSARAHDPTLSKAEQTAATKEADTLFKGEALKSMLNQAWTFSVIARIASVASIACAAGAVLMLIVLGFETAATVRATRR